MERTPLGSRTVIAAGYDPLAKTLEIELRGQRVYRYFDVPAAVYDWLCRTPNKGGYVSRMIRDRYRYEEITERPEPQDLVAALEASLASLKSPE